MSPPSKFTCPSTWLVQDVMHEGHDVHRSQSSQSTSSTTSDVSTALSRTDVSPFSLNGNGSSTETSPATSSYSNKTRRLSDVMEADHDEFMSSNAPIPSTKRRKSSPFTNLASSSSTLTLQCPETTVKRPVSNDDPNVTKLNDNVTMHLSRTLFVESLVGKFVKIWTMF